MSFRMLYKGIYAGRPALFQLFLLLLLLVAGALLSSLASSLPLYLLYGSFDLMNEPGAMRWLQVATATGTFLLPSLAIAWLCSTDIKSYLSIRPLPQAQIWALVLLSMLLLSPAISLLGAWNQQMSLPEFMAPIENWMRRQEDTAQQLTERLLQDLSYLTLFFNLIVVAVVAGITEEFFFRGALQRILNKWASNHHLVIWTAAILFSSFHLQFFGFVPRLLLGAYFGYLLYWGKNIWIPVFAHFANNATAVVVLSDNELRDNQYLSGEIPSDQLAEVTLASAIMLFLFIGVTGYLKKKLQQDNRSAEK